MGGLGECFLDRWRKRRRRRHDCTSFRSADQEILCSSKDHIDAGRKKILASHSKPVSSASLCLVLSREQQSLRSHAMSQVDDSDLRSLRLQVKQKNKDYS